MSLNSGSFGQMLQKRGIEAMVAVDLNDGYNQRPNKEEVRLKSMIVLLAACSMKAFQAMLFPGSE